MLLGHSHISYGPNSFVPARLRKIIASRVEGARVCEQNVRQKLYESDLQALLLLLFLLLLPL